MRKSIFFLLLLTPALVSNTVRADETPRTGVVDRAGVMRPTEIRQLNEWLLELEQKTGAQLKVLIVPTTGGQDIYQFSIDTARRWRLGQKGKNNGALVVVATQDRKWHVQTGEGVEAALPDILVDQIAQENFVPNFRKGEYSRGIFLGTTELARAIAKDSGVELGGLPAQQVQRGSRTQRNRSGVRRDGGAGSSCCVMVLPFIVLILVFGSIAASARRMNRGAWGHGRRGRFSPGSFVAGMLLNNMLGGRRGGGGWSSGGSSWGGGGGGGGFGGGGGGSFGGGGAGGSW